jgi:two-component system NtrC family sensor kinase
MSAKILIVDDETDLESLISQKFKKQISADEYQFIFARNGIEALTKLQLHPDIDMVLSDINMPEMDGLTLLATLNHLFPSIKIVMISDCKDIEKMRLSMNNGAFDFLIKPLDFKDLEITINKTLQQVQILKKKLQLQQKKEEKLQQSEKKFREQVQELQQELDDLKRDQVQLIQTEKMSSLSQLVAGIAHEINNPVNFISGNLIYVSDYIQELLTIIDLYQQNCPDPEPDLQSLLETIDLNFLSEDLFKIVSSMKVGSDRLRKIVLSLRNFSRLDESGIKQVNIHEGIDNTLMILQHRLKSRGTHEAIEVIREYGDLPLVECYPGELNQVFMHIINNAIDAFDVSDQESEYQPKFLNPSIWIRTEVLSSSSVVIQIKDNGSGMTESVKKRLFDPFFTTKPVGKGTGLGLAVSYQLIVEKHKGVLRCESEVGKGTSFWVEIPFYQLRSAVVYA